MIGSLLLFGALICFLLGAFTRGNGLTWSHWGSRSGLCRKCWQGLSETSRNQCNVRFEEIVTSRDGNFSRILDILTASNSCPSQPTNTRRA
jgi:hypothetical protein